MIELPEAAVLADQISKYLKNKIVKEVTVNHSPHKFAWFSEEPEEYGRMLNGKKVDGAQARSGMVEAILEDIRLLFSDGVNLKLHNDDSSLPKKHQLLLEFEDGSYLSGSVQMYGGLVCFKTGFYENEYYQAACDSPSPMTGRFTPDYFMSILEPEELGKKSIKEVLATKQRIPGLGNGVLQDILYNAGIHPKRKLNTIPEEERAKLYTSITGTFKEMYKKGGRDTESDLLGNQGGYTTKMSRNTVGETCSKCGGTITKAAFMGGSVYFCPGCQTL